ncbi:MAG: universal stress protein [Saprospiraceae bacterium]|nr:universal stress protein [Saprospiraceae bacterium]
MPNIQKILFPTSCSENAKKAFRYTLSMAKYFGASVDVLHVCEPSIDILTPSVMRYQLLREQKQIAEKKLAHWIKEFEVHNIPFNHDVEMGFAKETIASFANKAGDFDLIAMGTEDNNSLTKIIWGTIISKTVESARVPVLVIPKGIIFQDIQNIAYLAPDSKGWRSICDQVKQISVDFAAKLFITHLPNAKYDVLNGENHIVLDDYVRALNLFAYNNNLHLLVTISSNRNTLQRIFRYSKAQKMAFKTTIPLLVLRER